MKTNTILKVVSALGIIYGIFLVIYGFLFIGINIDYGGAILVGVVVFFAQLSFIIGMAVESAWGGLLGLVFSGFSVAFSVVYMILTTIFLISLLSIIIIASIVVIEVLFAIVIFENNNNSSLSF
jgi:hypothetical protein